ncbi:hypothetical protein RM549_03485 [Salegentibacter sp. F188]|uniref:Glycosyltransferase n=1 Tax=Autumnicola patrickiae TaxID=3075591 RepID=A0ABU3DZE4_9FLAO|nr:hypothetical protein [Salegentibacter sp. F188]MDT0688829.1 hypothetical protein [Salegentibacter sp. F188]
MKGNHENVLVTLYGPNYIQNDWTIPCMKSWKNILNISHSDFYVLPDKTLSATEKKTFSELNFKTTNADEEIDKFLNKYPALKFIRENDATWRKIIDVGIIFREAEKITIIDTDVFVKDQINLPLKDIDIVYMREDIPAYRGKWNMVWKEKMVPALNAGIVIVDPKIIDYGYLESLVLNYLQGCKNYWWSEQSAWACLAGKSKRRFVFSGEQVRVTSGMRQRSAKEISNNSYKYFGNKEMIKNYKEFEPLLYGGSIFHFAGPGKYMFKKSQEYLLQNIKPNSITIDAHNEETLNFQDKIFISMRLYLKEKF